MVAVASRAASPLPAPPPSPPPLPSPPSFTPSPPVARRVASDASLDSDDVKPSASVIRTLSSPSSPLSASVSHGIHCSFGSPPAPPVPSMSTATASSSSPASSASSSSSSSSSFNSSPPSAFFEDSDATDKNSHNHHSSSSSDLESSSDSASQSPVESYVEDIGSPIIRKREDLLHPCVPRSSITRTYDSTDDDTEQSSSNGDIHVRSSTSSTLVDNSSATVTAGNPSRRPRPRPRPRPRSILRQTHISPYPIDNKQTDTQQLYARNLKDYLSHEEEHDDDEDNDNIIDDDDDQKDVILDNYSRAKRSRPVYQPQRSRHNRANYKSPTSASSCSRVEGLSKRVDSLARELAALQMITAGRAADADIMKASTNDRSSDGLLRGEACRLRITLNHVAKLTLEKAFSVRDELERHR